MFKNLKNKTGIKIAGATMTIIFSLAATFSGTIAWFNVSHNASMSAGSFQIVNSNSQLSTIEFHEFYGIENNKILFNIEQVGEGADIDGQTATFTSPVTMVGTYSSENPHHPVLIILNFSTGGSATIKAIKSTDPNDYPYIATDDYRNDYLDTTEDHPLSSVVEFYAFTYASIPTEGGYYAIPTSSFTRKTSEAKAFPEFDDYGEYQDRLDSEVTVFSGSTSGMKLAIIIDYFSESLEYIYSYYMGNSTVSDGLHFSCDWGLCL